MHFLAFATAGKPRTRDSIAAALAVPTPRTSAVECKSIVTTITGVTIAVTTTQILPPFSISFSSFSPSLSSRFALQRLSSFLVLLTKPGALQQVLLILRKTCRAIFTVLIVAIVNSMGGKLGVGWQKAGDGGI